MWVPKKRQSKYKRLSLSKILKKKNKIDKEFEVILNSLSLEEVIGLKLELASKTIGGKLYGLPIIQALPRITQEAALLYTISAASTKMEAARFLGLSKPNFNKLLKKYNITDYFKDST
jgi:hypothetical protein